MPGAGREINFMKMCKKLVEKRRCDVFRIRVALDTDQQAFAAL